MLNDFGVLFFQSFKDLEEEMLGGQSKLQYQSSP